MYLCDEEVKISELICLAMVMVLLRLARWERYPSIQSHYKYYIGNTVRPVHGLYIQSYLRALQVLLGHDQVVYIQWNPP